MAALRRTLGWLVALGVTGLLALLAWGWARRHPQDLPWTPLDLGQPVGMFTGRKLTALTDDFPQCRALLDRAGVRYTALPTVRSGQCGYSDGVRFASGGARRIGYRPADLGVACPVAAALALWEWEVVQPAAAAHFGQAVASIDHFGSYSCRRLYGRDAGAFSEHATADAVDIAGFRLADGTRISVVGDWAKGDAKAAFLRQVHGGACGLFATVLGPDYNAAHRDHFHFDQAARGAIGWRGCR
ncbi:MAG: extensin family protein [Pseudomonadota bacterium]